MNHKKLIVFYSTLLVATVTAMIVLRGFFLTGGERDYDEIAAEGVMRVVTEYNSAGYFVAGDTAGGFQYELMQAVSELSGIEILIIPETSPAAAFKGLKARRYDVVAANIPVTEEAKERYLFTDPVMLNKQTLVQRSAKANGGIKPIRNQLDLAKKTLHIPAGSPAILRIHNLQHEIGDTIFIAEENSTTEELIDRVAKGEIEYAVCDMRTADAAARRLPAIDIATPVGFMQLQSWAVRKESTALCDSLNRWLQHLRDKGFYDKIYKKYYKVIQ